MNLLLFAGSLRTGSLNKKLLLVAKEMLTAMPDCTVSIIDIKSLSLPVYDADIEAVGIPEGVKTLGQLIQNSNALVISSPEYNGSISSPLKNTIDWISRLKPVPFEKKPVFMMGASPGYFGAIRSLSHSRQPLESLGAFVFPKPFALPKAAEAILPSGDLADAAIKKNLNGLLTEYVQFAKKLSQ